jgi:outer membrane lipoprotein-sorting protein
MLRWLVPTAAAVVVIGGGAAAGTLVASAEPSLPERSAAQLLVDLQGAKVDGFSGTVVQTADLGLQKVPALANGGSGADVAKLITGNNTVRIWYAGEDKVRLALLGVLGETDMIRNGKDVWLWRSQNGTATHLTVPAGAETPHAAPTGLPSTP